MIREIRTGSFKKIQKLLRKKKYEECFGLAKQLAHEGNNGIQVFWGWLYENGGPGMGCEVEALKWYEIASRNGSLLARFALGNHFLKKKNYSEAFKYYKIAAEQGHFPSCYGLGRLYQNGVGVEKDEDVAMTLFKTAALRGHVFAKAQIARKKIKSAEFSSKIIALFLYCGVLYSIFYIYVLNRYDERLLEDDIFPGYFRKDLLLESWAIWIKRSA